jgi:hypothetical protein
MMKKKITDGKNQTLKEIKLKYQKIEAELSEAHDEVFTPEVLSIEQIEHELFLDQATKSKKDDSLIIPKNEESQLKQETGYKKQIDDIHRATFPTLKTLTKEEQIKIMQANILKSKARKRKA